MRWQPCSSLVRAVGDRVYFLRQGIWTDSTYADEQTLDIVAYSDAYFALITRIPWIAAHLAIGLKVILRVSETYVRVGDEGDASLTEEERDRVVMSIPETVCPSLGSLRVGARMV